MTNILKSKSAIDIALIIEEYRQEKNSTDKYILEHGSRKEMENALRDFYKKQGVENISDEMIRTAIEEHESKRLRHSAAKIGAVQKFLANKAIGSIGIAKSGIIERISVVALAAMSIIYIFTVLDEGADRPTQSVDTAQEQATSIAESHLTTAGISSEIKITISNLKFMISDLGTMIIETKKTSKEGLVARHANDFASEAKKAQDRLKKSVEDNLLQAKVIQEHGGELPAELIHEASFLISKSKGISKEVGESLGSKYTALMKLIDQESALREILSTQLYSKNKDSKKVVTALDLATFSLEMGDSDTSELAVNGLRDIIQYGLSEAIYSREVDYKKIPSIINSEIAAIKTKSNTLSEHSAKKHMSEAISRIENAHASGDTEQAWDRIEKAKELYDYIQKKSEIRIVLKPGISSVLSRVSPYGSTSYYLIVQSLDSSGSPFDRVLKNTEYATNYSSPEVVKTWGMGVSKEVYQKFFDEKSKTGKIENTLVGTKEAGSYSIKPAITITGSTITNW